MVNGPTTTRPPNPEAAGETLVLLVLRHWHCGGGVVMPKPCTQALLVQDPRAVLMSHATAEQFRRGFDIVKDAQLNELNSQGCGFGSSTPHAN